MEDFRSYVEFQSMDSPNRIVRSVCFKLLESWKKMEAIKAATPVLAPPPAEEIVWNGMKAGDRAEYTEAGDTLLVDTVKISRLETDPGMLDFELRVVQVLCGRLSWPGVGKTFTVSTRVDVSYNGCWIMTKVEDGK